MYKSARQHQVSTYSVSHSSHGACSHTGAATQNSAVVRWKSVLTQSWVTLCHRTSPSHLNARGRFPERIHYHDVTSRRRVYLTPSDGEESPQERTCQAAHRPRNVNRIQNIPKRSALHIFHAGGNALNTLVRPWGYTHVFFLSVYVNSIIFTGDL